jgi:antigen 43
MSLSLGTAAPYAILTPTPMFNDGTTTVTGNVGCSIFSGSNAPIIFISGSLIEPLSPSSPECVDALAAYNTGINYTPTVPAYPGGTDLSSLSPLSAGIYRISGNATLSTTLVLNGPGTYIFQILGTLTTSSLSVVTLLGGATSCNVFWLVAGDVTYNATSSFVGTTLTQGSISAGFVDFIGRIISVSSVINLASVTVTLDSTCVCYCKGTQIKTVNGYRPIESLHVGDSIETYGNIENNINVHEMKSIKKIKWIGRYTDHNLTDNTFPICIKKDALAPNIPFNDLFVSPMHSIIMGDKMTCAINLVNGATTIYKYKEKTSAEYYHLELDDHYVISSNGVLSESLTGEANKYKFISI